MTQQIFHTEWSSDHPHPEGEHILALGDASQLRLFDDQAYMELDFILENHKVVAPHGKTLWVQAKLANLHI